MKILVISDSHQNTAVLKKILNKHSDIVHVFFLGDNTRDIENIKEDYKNRVFHIVSGNCDYSSSFKSFGIETIENTLIYFCHGHKEGVKYSTEDLLNTAKEYNCKIALFGHTHKSHLSYNDYRMSRN